MKKVIIVVVSFLMGLLLFSCGSSGNGTLSSPIVLTTNSGPVSPDYSYHETVTISGDEMEINRTGGSNVIVGDWKVTLTSAEATHLNGLLGLIDPVSDADIISSIKLGGGSMELRINENVTFTNGPVFDEVTSSSRYHMFSPDVKNLADYINTLLKKYGYYNKAIGT